MRLDDIFGVQAFEKTNGFAKDSQDSPISAH